MFSWNTSALTIIVAAMRSVCTLYGCLSSSAIVSFVLSLRSAA